MVEGVKDVLVCGIVITCTLYVSSIIIALERFEVLGCAHVIVMA